MLTRRCLALLVAGVVPACLDVPEQAKPECNDNTDCHGSEVCESHTCWGDPPTGEFAFVLSPPADRPSLVTREIMDGTLTPEGNIQGLVFEKPVKLAARFDVVCTPPMPCDRTQLMATVTVQRDSLFAGGPGVKLVTMSALDPDGPYVTVSVPPGDPARPYTMTVVPLPRGDASATAGPGLAETVPPMRFTLGLSEDLTKRFTLGGVGLATIDGTLLAAGGGGLEDYRVVALGRWEADAPATEVSTVAYTASNGAFHLTLSPDLVGSVEIVARPSDPLSGKPTLHLLDVPYAIGTQRTLSEPSGLGMLSERTIVIRGKDGNGAVKPVIGARVRISAIVGTAQTGTAVITDETTTDDSGTATLKVYDGVSYQLEVVPPASSTVGAIYGEPFQADSDPVILPSRTRLRGVVFDAQGEPLEGVSVTARPSLRFVWSLDDAPQTFLNAVPVSTAVTNDQGEYVVWVDPIVADTWGYYDLALEPARSTGFLERAPTWVQPDVEIPRDASVSSVTVPDVWLPDAAFVHGQVFGTDQVPVENAEVKVFRMNSRVAAVCESVRNAPVPCPAASELLGRGTSDSNGVVELTLPR